MCFPFYHGSIIVFLWYKLLTHKFIFRFKSVFQNEFFTMTYHLPWEIATCIGTIRSISLKRETTFWSDGCTINWVVLLNIS